MNRNPVFFSVGILLASFLLVEARAQSRASGGNRSSATRKTRAKRPSGSNVRANFLKNYAPRVAGLPTIAGSGGSAKSGITANPLEASRKDPASFQKKRKVPSAVVPKPKKPSKPQVMTPVPARPGHARKDRAFVNGLTPQNSIYLGHEGSSIRKVPDHRAALAKLAAPTKSKQTHPPSRSFSTRATKPHRTAAK
jgi:hypothetical protein